MAVSRFHGKAHYEVENGWPTKETLGNRDNYEVTDEGCVLRLMERNGYDDSDFYAYVWDPETGTVTIREYATTRAWTYANSAVEDATPETLDAVRAYAAARGAEAAAAHAAAESVTAKRDDEVEVTGGRKYLGRTGRVFWRGEDKFNSSRWSVSYRVGIMTHEGDKIFVPEAQVKVTLKAEPVTAEQTAAWAAQHARSLLSTWGVK